MIQGDLALFHSRCTDCPQNAFLTPYGVRPTVKTGLA